MNDGKNERQAPGDEEFARKASALFDDSVAGLDAQTRARLNRSRQQALAAAARALGQEYPGLTVAVLDLPA